MGAKLSQIPFIRILGPFALGIIAELYLPSHSILLYIAGLFLCLLFLWNLRNTSYPLRWVSGALAVLFLFSAGYSIALLHTPDESKDYAAHFSRSVKDSMIVTIISIPQEKQKTIKATIEIIGIVKNGRLTKTTGKALFYFYKDSLTEKLNYGDEVLVYSQLHEIEPPSNPDEFNYKQFLQTRGINYECFVSLYGYSLTGIKGTNALLRFANNSRKKLALLLHKDFDGNEAEVASAILLGYREDLSPNVVHSFTDSGVVHVICVAGLHVGILFLLLSYIIVFPEKWKYGETSSVILILLLLWLYALLTGLATPVMRATIMFSFLTIGKLFRRYNNTVNILAASAFLLLLSDPFSIADTGFQLSYLSVLGIILIYKPLLSILNPENVVFQKIWELTCVSVAAQVAVFPLSVFYFHQFPNYFIVTNILVVPLLTLVICTGIFFLLTSWIPYISVTSAWILQKCLMLMNVIVSGVSHLPFSVTKGISISLFDVFLLFICITCILAFFHYRKYSLLICGLLAFTVFADIRVTNKIIHSGQQLFVVYNIPGKSASCLISSQGSVMPFSKIDSNDIAMHIQYNRWKLGVKNNTNLNSDTDAVMLYGHAMFLKQFVQFNNLKIVFIRQNAGVPVSPDKLTLQYVVVSEGYDLDMINLKNAFNFDTLIFDSSVPDYKLKKWEEECKQLNLHFYSVKTQGAYIKNC